MKAFTEERKRKLEKKKLIAWQPSQTNRESNNKNNDNDDNEDNDDRKKDNVNSKAYTRVSRIQNKKKIMEQPFPSAQDYNDARQTRN